MHLLNRYALSCGVKIDKPFILEHYYPITLDKYVVFQTSGKGNSRQYDYWSKVFSLIKEYTNEYKIVHVGLPTDQTVLNCDLDLRGKTSIKQLAYIIKNSSLYLGVDSFSAHLAGHYNKKIVSLYSYCYAQNCAPIWGEEKNKTLIEVDWSLHGKPSFSLQEESKKINSIYPEKIAKAVLDQLQIKNDLDKVSTLHIGKYYHTPVIEVVPDSIPKIEIIKDKICNIRMDYHFDERNLFDIANVCNVNIITDKKINLGVLNGIKSKILGLNFIANMDLDINYINNLKLSGIKISLVAPNNDQWNNLAEKFFDFSLEKEDIPNKKNIKNINKIDESCVFSSEKIILSKGKVYSNKLFWQKDLPKLEKYAKVVDHPTFWEDSEHFHIIKDERSNKNY